MKRKNPFDGDSRKTQLMNIIYKKLMTRQWVTFADFMADYHNLSLSEINITGVSNYPYYGELKKAFIYINKEIKTKVHKDCIETEGNNRNKRFRYIGENNDPLVDMIKAKVINNLNQYWKFCQDSAGFFPKSWLEYFFRDCWDLLDIKERKKRGKQIISTSVDRVLTNIDYLPLLYVAIENKQVLEIDYKPFEEEQKTLIFHPHHLKEFNGRWFLLGHAEMHKPENGFIISLDRIQSKPREKSIVKFIDAPSMFYEEYFYDIIGVSHMKETKVEKIIIRAYTYYMFKLMETKPIHHSQKIVTPFNEHKYGQYGEFSIHIKINHEFIGRILQMGADLEIVSPQNIRLEFAKRTAALSKLYNDKK